MATRKRVVVEAVPRKRACPAVQSIRILVLHDEDPDISFLDQPEFADRREAYQRGEFSFVGVVAEAEVVVEGVVQHITSGGLWGIESDAGEGHILETAADEYADLRKILKSLGVPTTELPSEMDTSWVEWRA